LASLQLIGVPTQPFEVQTSLVVQELESVQGVTPSVIAESTQRPVAGEQALVSHCAEVVQFTVFNPIHWPEEQISVKVQALLSLQGPLTLEIVQVPVVNEQVF
jgi:hypothetical protein